MDNPWKELPEQSPYILPQESSVISEFRARCKKNYQIQSQILPEPYIGNVDAPIYLLSLNPGYSDKDLHWHSKKNFKSAIKSNLLHEPIDYPFYFLNPEFRESPGAAWWQGKLKRLIFDTTLEIVANNIFCVEYFSYHSENYKEIPKSISSELLKSQRYSIYLVRQAIKRNANVIIMRSSKKWFSSVPDLKDNKNVYELRNPQNVCVTPNNLDNYYYFVDNLKKC